jgi:hypothetical protein
MWLGRSGKLPLSIGILQGGFPSYQSEWDVVMFIFPFVSQISNLKVGFQWHNIERLLGSQDISALTNLEIRILDSPSCNLYHERCPRGSQGQNSLHGVKKLS